MKWTKFKAEFDEGGPLHRLLKKGDRLIHDPGTPVHPPEPNIWVSEQHDPVIDNCFRIYTDPDSLEKATYRGTDPYKRESNYHPWVYFENVPEEYLNAIYTDSKSVAHVFHLPKDSKVFPPRPLPLGGERPHPYEVFAGGWVHFYDTEVRHGELDHAIYFEWGQDHKEKKNSVTIYIYQTKPNINWNVYVRVNPPTSQDPPPVKSPPPYC